MDVDILVWIRLGMVADIEEQKQKVGIKGRLLGGQGAAKRMKTSGMQI